MADRRRVPCTGRNGEVAAVTVLLTLERPGDLNRLVINFLAG
jgi:hypothetical protein